MELHRDSAGAGEGAGDGGATVALGEGVVGHFYVVVLTTGAALKMECLKREHNLVTIACCELPFL